MKKVLDVLEVFPEIEMIKDSSIREKTIRVWQILWDTSKWEDINLLPCSLHKSDCSQVKHNRSVVLMAVGVADSIEKIHGIKINRDYLISAALLQDVSKLIEYEPCFCENQHTTKAIRSDIGERFTHSFYGAHIALQVGLPNEIIEAILDHSPSSPSFPKTLIGKILFYVDQIDMAAIKGDRWKKAIYIYR